MKDCVCTIATHSANCKGEHARNLSEAARYLSTTGGDINLEMPRKVRTPSRNREDEEPFLEYVDPPYRHARSYSRGRESSGESFQSDEYREAERALRGKIEERTVNLVPNSGNHYLVGNSGDAGGDLVEDSSFLAVNRMPLNKFEALTIGGRKVTTATIGGFEIDLRKVAEKANEIAPLPASKLPVIFVDQDLNFYHHFFKGIVDVMTQEDLNDVVSSDSEVGAEPFVMKVVEKLLMQGYKRSDPESVLLVKKILQSTFEMSRNRTGFEELDQSIEVVTNIWGFQYIEPGMNCREGDLRMWLTMCWNHYKTIWFNSFKMTGIPAFATSPRSRRSSSNSSKSLRSIAEVNELPNKDSQSGSTKTPSTVGRDRHHRRSKTRPNDNRIVRWMSES